MQSPYPLSDAAVPKNQKFSGKIAKLNHPLTSPKAFKGTETTKFRFIEPDSFSHRFGAIYVITEKKTWQGQYEKMRNPVE